ncbi:prepilin-type N-terminal cleavage/methylation domain-containing protein [Rickettsiales bacterium]|nr:prepilin-type N-terminal cleavage/methylation domain-containing protein [Rickettsiales bacterium]
MYFFNKNNIISACRNQNGVSLAELAVVIVIIALLTGAVVAGVKMQKASELRGIMTDVERLRVAIQGFDDKYNDLPGDMADAYDYWGASCDGTSGNCNGDGNAFIEIGTESNSEALRAWQHMDLAGFLEGGYTGVSSKAGNVEAFPGVNVPSTKRLSGGFFLASNDPAGADVATNHYYPFSAMPVIYLGSFFATSWPSDKFLTSLEAFSIDEKMDDGMVDKGSVYGMYYYNSSWQTSKCITGTYPNRTYTKTSAEKECVMYFTITN